MEKNFKILAFSGSTRKGSYNSAALRSIQKLAPEGMEIEIYDLKNLPFMNQDLEQGGWPEQVREFREKIFHADALLVSTPEYNNMMPGYLKNAFEWASRNVFDRSPLIDKPAAVMGASDGNWGTVRAQLQFLQLGAVLKMRVNSDLRLAIPEAQNKFNEKGELIDKELKERMIKFLENFQAWLSSL